MSTNPSVAWGTVLALTAVLASAGCAGTSSPSTETPSGFDCEDVADDPVFDGAARYVLGGGNALEWGCTLQVPPTPELSERLDVSFQPCADGRALLAVDIEDDDWAIDRAETASLNAYNCGSEPES